MMRAVRQCINLITHPVVANRVLRPVEQAWFHDPLTWSKGVDVVAPIRKTWGKTNEVVSIAGAVYDGLEDRPICNVADDGTLGTALFNGGCANPQRVVFDRDAS